jgi:ATP-binding cassette subfamily C protein EexD
MAKTASKNTALPDSPLHGALGACRSAFLHVGLFSLCINVLMLVPTIYMMTVYDRVLGSGSEVTLVMVTIITLFLLIAMGSLEWIRSRILVAASLRLDDMLGVRVFNAAFDQALVSSGRIMSAQPLADLQSLRQFLGGPGPMAFFDAPWYPIYLTLLFLFHPWFGVAGLTAGAVLFMLTLWNETATRNSLANANQTSIDASQFTQRNLRNVEVVTALGMLPRIRTRWQAMQSSTLTHQARASATGGLIGAISRTFRLAIQSLILGLGAYLAIRKEISPGMVIAGSVLLGRALAPLDTMINSWRGFAQAREAFTRLNTLFSHSEQRETPMPLPVPTGRIGIEHLTITPFGAAAPVLKGINFVIESGSQLAVIGPSGSGKSTLARAVLGLHRPAAGSVRIDGGDILHWDRERLGLYLGYLPQDVELFDGSIAENISRFGDVDADAVVSAARLAGIHEMILRLPDGYGTKLLGGGYVLSAGQQQRIGIARAIYGNPKVVVLDEPNSNLDQEGDAALGELLTILKTRGVTVVLVTHRPNSLAHVDKIALIVAGQIAAYGPRADVLALMEKTAQSQPATSAIAIAKQVTA